MWGSQAYLEELDPAQREDIALYLNFDMIGSPNYVRFVYDGDGPTLPFGDLPPEGSGEIEEGLPRLLCLSESRHRVHPLRRPLGLPIVL